MITDRERPSRMSSRRPGRRRLPLSKTKSRKRSWYRRSVGRTDRCIGSCGIRYYEDQEDE